MYHIVLNSDENYIKYASVLITNIIHNIDKNANYPSNPLHFHILTNTIKQETQENLKMLQNSLSAIYPCDISIHYVDENFFKDLPTLNGNHSALYRLLIAEHLSCDIQTCLYLDIDMVVFCDIREIFTFTCSSAIAAIPDFATPKDRFLQPIANSTNFAPPPRITFDNYFNDGFLYINLQKFRSLNIPERTSSFSKQYKLKYHEQDILNAIIQDSYQPLSFAYNFMPPAFRNTTCTDEDEQNYNVRHTREEFKFIAQNIKFLHYTADKPWLYELPYTYQGRLISEFWWEYVAKTPIFQDILYQIKKYDALGIGLSVLQSKGFFKFLKLPFIIAKIMQSKTQISPKTLSHYDIHHIEIAYELGKKIISYLRRNKKLKWVRLYFRLLRDIKDYPELFE